jgi:hypothetical protein
VAKTRKTAVSTNSKPGSKTARKPKKSTASAKKKTSTKTARKPKPKTTAKTTDGPSKKTTSRVTAKRKSAAESAKPKVIEAGQQEVTIDRRTSDRRQEEQHSGAEAPAVERRKKVPRRRQIDPTTCERDYSNEEIEFMRAIEQYKRDSGRMFPTCSEVLEVIRELGYAKTDEEPTSGTFDSPSPVSADPYFRGNSNSGAPRIGPEESLGESAEANTSAITPLAPALAAESSQGIAYHEEDDDEGDEADF